MTRSADAIADDLDGRGASLSVVAGRHQMAIAATCLSDDFPAVLALAADIARHPRFADEEIETRRDNLITSIRQEEDNPASMAADAFAKALYGTHPYARKVRGTIAGIEAIRRQDLVRFHQKGFDPSAITVIVVGDIEEDAAIAAVSKLFGDWSADRQGRRATSRRSPCRMRRATAERKLVSVPMMNKAQADVVYGFAGIRRSDPDYTAYSVMNNALGQYAIGGRLGDSIRERQGMAYYVFSSLDATFGPGPFSIRAGVVRRQRREDDRVDRRGADGGSREGLHRAGDRRVEELHDRRDPAPARDQRRDRVVPADRRHVRSRPGLRRAAARLDRRDHEGSRRCRGEEAARSVARDHRRRRALESASLA